MFAFFRPAAHQAPLPDEQIDDTYKRLRWQIFAGIFIGYAGYYLLRKNFKFDPDDSTTPDSEAFPGGFGKKSPGGHPNEQLKSDEKKFFLSV